MEPAPEERDDLVLNVGGYVGASTPQWSPLLKSGMTVRARPEHLDFLSAAMEPAPEERDDLQLRDPARRPRQAAMEPAPEERDDAEVAVMLGYGLSSRNGARS